jgi:hypothetical protein
MAKDRDHSFQVKVTLKGLRPPVWRRILVPASYTFWDLHVALQDAMGWLDCHLHAFRMASPTGGPEVEIGIPLDEPSFDGPEPLPGWVIPIASYFTLTNRTATYLYDFGDHWEHSVRLEEIAPIEESVRLPVCLAGRRRCPPEDVGGVGGFEQCLSVVADPSHEDHDDTIAWVGGAFDPALFDKSSVRFTDPQDRWELAFVRQSDEFREPPTLVPPGALVPVSISLEDRQLIIDHTFADAELVDRLRVLGVRGGELQVGYTLRELDELLQHVAAQSNHTSDRLLRKRLDALYDRLSAYEALYREDAPPG